MKYEQDGTMMGQHDDYGKKVLREASREAYIDWGNPVEINYGAGRPARIDATVSFNIAVEIESRVSKQVRGALLDLICHHYPKKLLILLPVHMSDPEITKAQCENILARFLRKADFRVVLLRGSGDFPSLDFDIQSVREALQDLGF